MHNNDAKDLVDQDLLHIKCDMQAHNNKLLFVSVIDIFKLVWLNFFTNFLILFELCFNPKYLHFIFQKDYL
jgi:hypothetical protein